MRKRVVIKGVRVQRATLVSTCVCVSPVLLLAHAMLIPWQEFCCARRADSRERESPRIEAVGCSTRGAITYCHYALLAKGPMKINYYDLLYKI